MSLAHALLRTAGLRHGFGVRGDAPPTGLRRPRQVHGARVVRAAECDPAAPPEADAIVARAGDAPVGVVTADCVPVLVAARDGAAVVAIHAGWRGLAAGVVAAGVAALRDDAGGTELVAAIGPHVGACCYEVDEPVVGAMRHRFASFVDASLRATRPGHWQIDLGGLVRHELARAGLADAAIGAFDAACTACDAERFHSYRRDGPRSGRLVHWIEARTA